LFLSRIRPSRIVDAKRDLREDASPLQGSIKEIGCRLPFDHALLRRARSFPVDSMPDSRLRSASWTTPPVEDAQPFSCWITSTGMWLNFV
jgi:hypothetical protein